MLMNPVYYQNSCNDWANPNYWSTLKQGQTEVNMTCMFAFTDEDKKKCQKYLY